MSHTSEIKAVAIVDIDALRQTVAELNKAGVKCSLLQNATPRAYFAGQQGMGLAPYVLKLDDAPYDVGFYDNGQGGYTARTDFWGGHVARVLGAKPLQGEDSNQAQLGKLFNSYAVNATVRQATKQGYRVMRNTQADGSVQLTLTN